MAVDDAALAIGSLIEFPDTMLAEQRKIVHDFFQVLPAPDLLLLPDLRTPSHDTGMLAYSLFLRLAYFVIAQLLSSSACGKHVIGDAFV